jgi:hypothetical protein
MKPFLLLRSQGFILREKKIQWPPAQDLFFPVAIDLLRPLIPVNNLPFPIHHRDGVSRLLNDGFEKIPGLDQLFLKPHLLDHQIVTLNRSVHDEGKGLCTLCGAVDVVEDTLLHGLYGHLGVSLGSDEDGRNADPHPVEPPEPFEAVPIGQGVI